MRQNSVKQGVTKTMNLQKLTGIDAGPTKYDILTALSVMALNGSPTLQTSMMRLVALITARYNWRHDEVTVGQRDMAKMWSVNERTVKREIKRLLESQFLICKRNGVRGRVAAYQLNYRRIADVSCTYWLSVGPDFAERMKARYQASEVTANVIPLNAVKVSEDTAAAPSEAGTWGAALARLKVGNANLCQAWFEPLAFQSLGQGVLTLKAPSKFFQRYLETHHLGLLKAAVETEIGPVDRIEFI